MVSSAIEPEKWCGLSELRGDVRRTLSPSCRDGNELDDLVQETLMRAARFRTSLQDAERLRSWVLRIAWNVMRDHVRRERRFRRAESGDDALFEVESREQAPGQACGLTCVTIAGRQFDREDVLHLLDRLWPEISSADRQLFDLYYTRGVGCRRAARELGVTVQTVKMRLHRLRGRVRRVLLKRAKLDLGPCFGERGVVA